MLFLSVGNLSLFMFEIVVIILLIVIMLEIIDFRRPAESRKNLYITNVPNEIAENELTVN